MASDSKTIPIYVTMLTSNGKVNFTIVDTKGFVSILCFFSDNYSYC